MRAISSRYGDDTTAAQPVVIGLWHTWHTMARARRGINVVLLGRFIERGREEYSDMNQIQRPPGVALAEARPGAPEPADNARAASTAGVYVAKLLTGPIAFALTLLVLPELPKGSDIVVATFVWMLVWWATEPLPMAVTTLLPLLVLPIFRVMPMGETASLYGQPVFFWIMGFSLFGYAMQKHGLAKRFAITLLRIPGVASSTRRLLFMYMVATGLVATFVSNVGVVAMMLPVGMSILAFAKTVTRQDTLTDQSRLGTFLALGTMYAAIAGGVATVAGVPSDAVALALIETLTGERVGFFRWAMIGFPMFAMLLVIYYFWLLYFFPPEVPQLPSGQEFLREEARKLGRMSRAEKNVLATFSIMVFLFLLPAFTPFLGRTHPFHVWVTQALSIWAVPFVMMFLLFALPVNLRTGEFTLDWKTDAVQRSPWEAMLMTTSAVAMTVALNRLGVIDLLTEHVKTMTISATALPFAAAYLGAIMTEFSSGAATTAILGNILIPTAQQVGFNPVSIGVLIANVAIGTMFPWSGPACAVAYSSGEVRLGDMFKIGLAASIITPGCIALLHLLYAPFF